MALHRQSLSPAANLLRHSRLFSLPNPLPKPPVSEISGAGLSKASDTATLPYPTHQAISTTKSSLARGDWGLKRPLPSRSHLVQISDPVLRITQLDTIEQVTEFDSAADHVRTRQKWEEMSVPMMKGMTQMRDYDISGTPPMGAFEVRDDTTSYDTREGLDEAGLYLEALKDAQKKNVRNRHRNNNTGSNEAAYSAFKAEWDAKWTAKKAEWANLDLQDRTKAVKAFQREEKNARQALRSSPAFKELLAQNQKASQPSEHSFSPFSPPPVDAAVHNTKRWKHEGPWIPGMSAEEFTTYIHNEISKRRTEFNTYLEEFVRNEIYTTRRLAAAKSGEAAPMDLAEAEAWQAKQQAAWGQISREDVAAGIRSLRRETANDPLGSKLLILPFLRLPAIKFKYKAYAEDASNRDVDQYQFDQETAPLSTHPSAGLGYLRTKAYLTNHPILGPQAAAKPIQSRVVQPRNTSNTKESYARLGVAGFVANDQYRSTDVSSISRAHLSSARDVETIDIDTVGGRKIPVQPLFGSVTNDGRIHIKLRRANGAEVAVARGELEDRPPVREGFDRNPLGSLGLGGVGGLKSAKGNGNKNGSGVKEAGEQSDMAKQLNSFLEGMKTPEGKH